MDPMTQFLENTVLCEITTANQGSGSVDDNDPYITVSMAVLLFEGHQSII